MRTRTLLSLAAATLLASPAAASADFAHVVAPGESLSSVAALDGLSVSQLAAANGVSSDSMLSTGSTLQIPPQDSQATAVSGTSSGSSEDTSSVSTPDASPDSSGTTTSGGSGSYVVQPGDTLSAIAARDGTSVDQLAAANGLDPAGILLTGAVLSLSGGSDSGAATEPVSTDSASSSGGAEPTPERVSAGEVGSIAESEGVSPSLAEAIGWQESGFNNDLVSSTGAVGVMQIEPGTWDYIGQNLAGPPPLQPASAHDNIRAGTLLLHSLLSDTGGDPALTAAGYYQGLQSVQQNGLYSDTQQYVNDVMALRQQFGGP
jgi:N-acetylmuramoyl-L-alanine amidase